MVSMLQDLFLRRCDWIVCVFILTEKQHMPVWPVVRSEYCTHKMLMKLTGNIGMRKLLLRFREQCVLVALLLVCTFVLTGCGSRVVLTKGFGSDELFRIGNTSCSMGEYRILLLDLQKDCENVFGDALWDSGEGDAMRASIENRALSEASRLEVMLLIAVQDNIMLTSPEINQAYEAGEELYDAMTEAEREYVDIDLVDLQEMYVNYALAQKVYTSIGSEFEERYNSFCTTLDYEVNQKLWDTVELYESAGSMETPGFSDIYRKYFVQS